MQPGWRAEFCLQAKHVRREDLFWLACMERAPK